MADGSTVAVCECPPARSAPVRTWVALSFHEGRVVRDLFHNGLLEALGERGIGVLLVTPAAKVPAFVREWSRPNTLFAPLPRYSLSRNQERALSLAKRLAGAGSLRSRAWQLVYRRLFAPDPSYVELIRTLGCTLAVVTNPISHFEMPFLRAAQEVGITTLGVVRSWDNLYKHLRLRPDWLAVWNEVNRREACRLAGYRPDRVVVTGASQFDGYFGPDSVWSREQFTSTMDLDPGRPIVTVATLGELQYLYDETYLPDLLLKAVSDGALPPGTQLVCRLHPASRLEHFGAYASSPDVRVSYMKGYIPTLGWTMTRDDVVHVANLLRHSDVVVSPGSTITVEAAIFDTPCVVPVFHPYQPELALRQFQGHTLATHYRRLVELDLVPIIEREEDLIPAINRCLASPAWYRSEREQLVRDYVSFTDGRSTQRVADLICRLALPRRA